MADTANTSITTTDTNTGITSATPIQPTPLVQVKMSEMTSGESVNNGASFARTYDLENKSVGLATDADIKIHGKIIKNLQTLTYDEKFGAEGPDGARKMESQQLSKAELLVEYADGYYKIETQLYKNGKLLSVMPSSGSRPKKGIDISKSPSLPPSTGNSGTVKKSFGACVTNFLVKSPLVAKATKFMADTDPTTHTRFPEFKALGKALGAVAGFLGDVAGEIAKGVTEITKAANKLLSKIPKIPDLNDLLGLENLKCEPDPGTAEFMANVKKAQENAAKAAATVAKIQNTVKMIEDMEKNGVTVAGVMGVVSSIDPDGVPKLLGLNSVNPEDMEKLKGFNKLASAMSGAGATYSNVMALQSIGSNFSNDPVGSIIAYDKVTKNIEKQQAADEAAASNAKSVSDHAALIESDHKKEESESKLWQKSVESTTTAPQLPTNTTSNTVTA